MKKKMNLYIGTYTEPIQMGNGEMLIGKGEGIYVVEYDYETSSFHLKTVHKGISNPSWFVSSKDKRKLYVVNELCRSKLGESGMISIYTRDPQTDMLELHRQISSAGQDPCHILVSPLGNRLYVSNYSNGVFHTCLISKSQLPDCNQSYVFHGNGLNQVRQTGSHIHSSVFSPDGSTLMVCDLGSDMVYGFGINPNMNAVEADLALSFSCEPGDGPRMGIYSACGSWFYLLNELSCLIRVYRVVKGTKIMEEIQAVALLPDLKSAMDTGAHLALHPKMNFLYASIRGHDSISVFRIDSASGRLERIGNVASGGKTPRCFCLDPAGEMIFVANQNSDSIVAGRIDRRTGLFETIAECNVPMPVFITLL